VALVIVRKDNASALAVARTGQSELNLMLSCDDLDREQIAAIQAAPLALNAQQLAGDVEDQVVPGVTAPGP
jgi:hypothetical protein